MARHNIWKRAALAVSLLVALAVLTGCATVPPQPITGLPEALITVPPGSEEISPGDGPSEAAPTPGASVEAQSISIPPATPSVTPTNVELFYSGAASMMGFADAFQTTIYENVMDALPACVSLCWSRASSVYYRYGADIAKEDMGLTKDQALTQVGELSFYRDTPMFMQPARLKREGEPVLTDSINMNEPIQSFYEAMDMDPPATSSRATGTPVAVAASDTADTSFSIIVTDLHELRMDDGALLTALNERCLQEGRTVGVAAIRSEFSGYIPDIGVNNTTYVWGSPPTGTLDYTLDYTEYKVGVSIDPEARQMVSRPFYVLCIGDQGAVDTFLYRLQERLTRELAANETFAMDTAVFGSGYVPADYTMAGNMRYIQGSGITAIPEASAPAGVNLIELKASQETRYLEWQLDYTIHPSDPRGLTLIPEDFTFIAEAMSEDGQTTILPNLSWSIVSAGGETITLALRLELPQGILPQGSYTLELMGSLSGPSTLPGADWVADYGIDLDGAQLLEREQNQAAFDGSRTLFLSRLIDTLGQANLGRLGVGPLGSVRVALTVYA